MGDQSRPPGHQHPDHIFHLAKFHMFTTTEVLRLSTKEITERKTFDELGHPIPNGLYDAALGPIEAHERCHTCQLLCSHCPGHVGHIQLPLPVFNPVLLDTTYKLFRGSCVFCHRFFCTKSILPVQLCLTQLALIDSGKLLEAHNVMEEVGGKDLDNVLVAADIEDKLKQLADSANLSVDDKKSVKERQLERNAGQARTALLTNFQRNYLYKVKTKCPHCNERQPRMRNEYSRIFALDFSKAVEATKKKYGNPDAGSKDEEYDPISGALEASNGIQEKIDPEDFLKNLLENAMGGPAITTPKSAKKSKKGKEGSEQKVVETPTDVRPGIEKQLDQIRQGAGSTHLLWGAAEVREHFRLLWDREADFLLNLFPMFRSAKQELDGAKRMSSQALFGVDMDSMRPIDILFSELTVVPPSKFRPPQFLNGEKYESGQTIALKNVMEQARLVGAILRLLHGRGTSAELLSLKEIVLTAMPKESDHSQRLRKAQVQLQTKVNSVFDSDLDSYDSKGNAGIRQLLEKKEGLFRKHMMGKRVNYAARSVITPDPYLAIDEIGVPEVFAKRLTFPEPVNDLNLPYMRKLLQAGPNVHPGANFFEDEFGTKQMIDTKDKFQRGNLVGRLTTPHAYSTLPPKTVMRQLRSGDALIMNRQPTLHKPSIMAHKTKVLGYQKAFRMNYAPCKAYNADFDGDEMNGHYVQNYVAKAEVHEIMIARKQYLVPKDGTPLLGLIQDHIISGVMLTLKDKFLTREDYNYLVLNAFPVRTDRIKTLPPTIIKPAVRWTGKQVISTVILNVIPPDQIPINLDGKAKTDVVNWQVEGHKVPERDMSESHVVFRGGELLVGVLDKAHYGPTPFGLIHSCYELYGPMVAGDILSALSRLFTTYLQIHGFTIGVKDILVSPQANKKRTKVIKSLRKCGPRVVRDAFELDEETEESDLRDLLRGIYTNAASKGDIKQLDFNMKQATDKFNDEINKACIPHGLIEKFPSNSLQLMIQAGAKGTMVNAMQISCMVGQIELEGCRPPLSATGRSLPSFKPYDLSPRAGGFVDQRFLTGLKPQELFFHTMAGREGLIDTAVKTSRSGYLQRCIIKHLEGIKVNYDHSVRDSDDSILQFQYGEDGMDICKVQYLGAKHFPFLKQNVKALLHSVAPSTKQKKIFAPAESTLPRIQEIEKWRAARPSNGHKLYASPFLSFCEKNEYSARMEFKNLPAYGDLVEKWHSCPASTAKKLRKKHKRCPDPILSTINSSQTIGCLSESFMDLLKEQGVKEKSVFREAINWKWLRSKAEPGENVGLLAAQSIGEPSTQMTLNTFHFAGRGEMNVTLGIPRLREILMVASKNLKTPTAEVPFRPGVPKAEAEKVRRDMDKVYLKSVLKGFQVEERITITEREFYRNYTVKVKLKSPKERPESDQLSRQKVMREMEDGFFKRLGWALNKRHQEVISLQELVHAQAKESAARRGAQLEDDALGDSGKGLMAADEGASSDEEGGAADSGATTSKYSKRHDDAAEYDGEEEEAKEPVFVLDSSFSEDEEEDSEEKEEEAEVEVDKAGRKTSLDPSQQMDPNRIAAVTKTSGLISEYQYDPKNHKWCTATFRLPMMKSKLDAATIVKIEIEKFVVYQTAGVEKTFLSVDGDNMILRTQGINLSAFFMRPEKLAVEKIRSNDIHMMLNTYGVEAAAKVLVQEVKGVFGNYGIEVNPRHLSLVSDYLMFTGEFRAFNRHYMDSHSSIMQRMTFETTTKYIKEGIIQGLADEVKSPSSAIILGTSMKGGTGAFDLYTPLDKALGIAKPVVVKAADAS